MRGDDAIYQNKFMTRNLRNSSKFGGTALGVNFVSVASESCTFRARLESRLYSEIAFFACDAFYIPTRGMKIYNRRKSGPVFTTFKMTNGRDSGCADVY